MSDINYTTSQAAEILGLKPRMVKRHCQQGRIEATKFGNVYMISEEALEKFKTMRRKPGQPRKGE